MAKTEVAEVDVPEVEVMNELDSSLWYKGTGGDVEPIDADEAQRQIVSGILNATTIDAIMAPVRTLVADDVIGQTLLIRGYRRMPSTKADSSLKFYLLIDTVDAFGEVKNVSCGSVNVMARLFALNANGFLPLYGALVRAGKQTASGYFPLDLEARTAEDASKEAARKASDF